MRGHGSTIDRSSVHGLSETARYACPGKRCDSPARAQRSDADAATSVLINGARTPALLTMRVGERYRLRIVDIHTFRPSMIARIVADSTPVAWRPVAKDGMDLPAARAVPRPAVQQMGNGETYDFEFVPRAPGNLRFTMSTAADVLLATLPIRVR